VRRKPQIPDRRNPAEELTFKMPPRPLPSFVGEVASEVWLGDNVHECHLLVRIGSLVAKAPLSPIPAIID